MSEDAVVRALADARALGFLGPGDVDDHIRHAEGFLSLIPPGVGDALDLGSGGGVPGLVLATRLAEVRWTLVDASRRRTSFLAAAVASLGLGDRVTVVKARAEDLGHDPAHRARYGAVTARSFAPPLATAEVGGAFVPVGGVLLVADPPGESSGDRWPPDALSRLGLVDDGGSVSPAIRRLRRTATLDDAFPRASVFRMFHVKRP